VLSLFCSFCIFYSLYCVHSNQGTLS
jgi:hypothetical protein